MSEPDLPMPRVEVDSFHREVLLKPCGYNEAVDDDYDTPEAAIHAGRRWADITTWPLVIDGKAVE